MRFLHTVKESDTLSPESVEGIVKRLQVLCADRNVALLYLHGSHARGDQGPLSDLDLAVLFGRESPRSLGSELDFLAALQSASGREDVDLVFLDRAGPIIKDRVVRYGRLVYQRSEKERILFEEKALKEYLDFRYFSKQYDEALFTALSRGRLCG
jgi:hypothetical protein